MKYMLYLGRALVKNVNIGGFLMSILFYLLIWLFYIAENIVFCELILNIENITMYYSDICDYVHDL